MARTNLKQWAAILIPTCLIFLFKKNEVLNVLPFHIVQVELDYMETRLSEDSIICYFGLDDIEF